MRETLYEELEHDFGAVRLHRAHGRGARACFTRLTSEPHLAELAHHFCEAASEGQRRSPKRSITRTRAAERADGAITAFEEAVAPLPERALEVLALDEPPSMVTPARRATSWHAVWRMASGGEYRFCCAGGPAACDRGHDARPQCSLTARSSGAGRSRPAGCSGTNDLPGSDVEASRLIGMRAEALSLRCRDVDSGMAQQLLLSRLEPRPARSSLHWTLRARSWIDLRLRRAIAGWLGRVGTIPQCSLSSAAPGAAVHRADGHGRTDKQDLLEPVRGA